MHVHVVIVNYGTAALVVECILTVAAEKLALTKAPAPQPQSKQGAAGAAERHHITVAVVDNPKVPPSDNDDATALSAAIQEHGWQDWVQLCAMPRNGGFAYGVNAGRQSASDLDQPPDAFFLLNPDTYIHPGAISELCDYLVAHPEAGMVGSRLEDPDGTVQHSRFRFPSLASEFDRGLNLGIVSRLLRRWATCPPLSETAHEIDWLSGAAMMIRRDLFDAVGPFDEDYFLYFEELDFARRAHAAGARSHYVPASRVVHLVGRSTGVTVRDRRPDRTPSYWFASRSRYFKKHHAWLYKRVVDVAFTIGRCGSHLLRVIRRRPYEGPPHYLWDFVRHNVRPW
ncbi:MAG: glycosyltransferase [Planctomycetota bacterium]